MKPLALGALVMVACLFGAEGITRKWILSELVPSDQKRFEELMHVFHPHQPLTPPEGAPVIVGLGDSFGYAGDSEGKNFFQILQKELVRNHVPAVIQNLSVTQYETLEELRMLEQFGFAYRPKLVLQAFFVGNDTHGNPPGMLKVLPNLINVRTPEFVPYRPSTWILPTVASRVFAYLKEQLRSSRQQAGRAPSAFSRETFVQILRGYLAHYVKSYPESQHWRETRETLIRTVKAAREHGCEYVLAILPDQLQIEDAYQDAVFEAPDLKREDFDLQLPQKLLRELGRELGIRVIDLYPDFRAQGRNGGLFQFQETHWNDEGNRLAGETLASGLIRSKLLGKPR